MQSVNIEIMLELEIEYQVLLPPSLGLGAKKNEREIVGNNKNKVKKTNTVGGLNDGI